MEIARRISSALTTSVEIGSDTVELRASVGVVWTMEALDTDTLIARADNAMYESKRLGEHGVTLFADTDMDRIGAAYRTRHSGARSSSKGGS
jgi:predicted signal transduction protein with EAL and GGDEF domain